jgi:hypothetical protein
MHLPKNSTENVAIAGAGIKESNGGRFWFQQRQLTTNSSGNFRLLARGGNEEEILLAVVVKPEGDVAGSWCGFRHESLD